jgi:predicted NodU family carbamoyl transferase
MVSGQNDSVRVHWATGVSWRTPNPDIQRICDVKIKFETFRPFAPASLAEGAAEYFEEADSLLTCYFAIKCVKISTLSVFPSITTHNTAQRYK